MQPEAQISQHPIYRSMKQVEITTSVTPSPARHAQHIEGARIYYLVVYFPRPFQPRPKHPCPSISKATPNPQTKRERRTLLLLPYSSLFLFLFSFPQNPKSIRTVLYARLEKSLLTSKFREAWVSSNSRQHRRRSFHAPQRPHPN